MNISTILDQIDIGAIALPEFQRGYVWNRDQVRKLMSSLYNDHPVGSLLIWETKTELVESHTRGNRPLSAGSVRLLLDGQQRITSLYGIIRGKSPHFFEGNDNTFKGLYFNLEEENFEFYAPLKMQNNPLWINVNDINTWVQEQGLPAGEIMYELVTDIILDLAWSNGLQEGKSQPVALILEKDNQIEAAANGAGYRYFTSIDSFKDYVADEILVLDSAHMAV